MQLKLQRSQRQNTWGVVVFCLDIRADYSAEERDNINKYRLGALLIYSSQAAQQHRENAKSQLGRSSDGNFKDSAAGLARGLFSVALAKMALNVSIASLSKGHHIECKDLQELLEAEETLRNACKDLTRYLEAAATFNGSELIIDYENGEERVHVAEATVPLIALPSLTPSATTTVQAAVQIEGSMFLDELKNWRATKWVATGWSAFENAALTRLAAGGLKQTPTQFRGTCALLAVFVVVGLEIWLL